MAVVRARSFSHTMWAAFLSQDGDLVKFVRKKSRLITWGHVSAGGRVPKPPEGPPPPFFFSLAKYRPAKNILSRRCTPRPYRRTRIKQSRMEHTHARALSPPAPQWPTRVCSQPIRDGRGGFAATLAHCAQLASGCHVTPAPVPRAGAGAGAGLARPTRRPARRFVSFSLLRVAVPPAAAPGPRRPRPPTGPAAPSSSRLPRRPPPSSGPAARQGVRRSRGRCQQRCRRAHSRSVARPLLWPAPSRPHAPRPPSAVQPSPPQRPSPGTGPVRLLHRPSGDPREHGCRAILHFPKNRRGGRDLLWRWSVRGLFPIQCGPHFISGRGLGEIPGETSRGVTCRPPRGPRQCRQLIPVLDMEDPSCNGDGHRWGMDQPAR